MKCVSKTVVHLATVLLVGAKSVLTETNGMRVNFSCKYLYLV